MKACIFSYQPTFTYLYTCESLEHIKNETYEFYAESDANSSGTAKYMIQEKGETVFEYTILLNHPEEEDLDLNELEGKFLIRELNVYPTQKIPAFYDKNESLEPRSVYFGLAYDFEGIEFGIAEENTSSELEEYSSEKGEKEERFFEYYKIIKGLPTLINL